MRQIIFLFLAVSLPFGAVHASPNIKELWKEKKAKPKKSHKDLWKKNKKTKPKKAKTTSSKSTTTVDRIKDSQSVLQETSSIQEQMNQQLEKIAKSIKKTTLESIAIDKVLKRLKKELQKNQDKYVVAQTSISKYGSQIDKLSKDINKRHSAFIALLSDQFALELAMKNLGGASPEAILRQETYEAIKEKNTEQLLKLKSEIDKSSQQKKKLVNKQNAIKQSISSLRVKRDLYDRKKGEKSKLLKKLSAKEDEYRKKLKDILKRQSALRQTLATLKIIRQKEIDEAKRAEAARRAELKAKIAQRKAQQKIRLSDKPVSIAEVESASNMKVKQYGSSYQANNIVAYRGRKTISPLKTARVVKKFGTYIDPIYKIKIFNDNVVLKSPIKGAKVRNVLNGKVVYIGKNSMLGKVIIVEHGNRLHTIYAALDRISPLLKVGSRVKKGVIIGRVNRKLIFQATQNSKYINPLRLINL